MEKVSQGGDSVIVTGDFNTNKTEQPYSTLTENALLRDSWKDSLAVDDGGAWTTFHKFQGLFEPGNFALIFFLKRDGIQDGKGRWHSRSPRIKGDKC